MNPLKIIRISPSVWIAGALLVFGILSWSAMSARPGLWVDEGLSVHYSGFDWPEFWRLIFHREANMALYYLILKICMIFGEGEGSLRAVSILSSAASLFMVYLIAKELFDSRTGLTAIWLLAVNAFFIHYAHEIRTYALLVFLTCASCYFFIVGLKRPSPKIWFAHGLTSILLLYSHFFGAWILLAQAVSVVCLPRGTIPWKQGLASLAGIFLLACPLLVFLFTTEEGQLKWVPPVEPMKIYNLFVAFTGNGGRVLLALYFFICLIPLWDLFQNWKRGGRSIPGWAVCFLLLWLFLPIVAAYSVSLTFPIFVKRYLIGGVPALVLIAAAGLNKIPNRLVFSGGLGLVLLLSVNGDFLPRHKSEVNWKEGTKRILTASKPGDGIVFFIPEGRACFDYYRRRMLLIPDHLTYRFPRKLSAEFLLERAFHMDKTIHSFQVTNPRLWLVLRFSTNPESNKIKREILLQRLNAAYTKKRVWLFGEMRLILFEEPV